MKRIFILLWVLLSFPTFAEQRRIELNDGTAIVGEIISMRNGSYTIRTQTLGTLTISDRQIKQISSATSARSSASPLSSGQSALSQGQVQSIQQRIAGDTAMLQRIMSLQSSPEMKAILSDPEVMSAIERFDLDALSKNPKIQRLMNNQTVKSITRDVN